MCGIYGFTGVPTKQTSGIIKRLGELNQSRGKDSTGLALIGISPDTATVYKNTVQADSFFKEQKLIQLLCAYRRQPFITILGHTRFATHGDVTAENAHPFKEGNYFFTHNGVISNFFELKHKYDVTYEVDSQIIGYLLSKKQTVFEAFKELSGSFAVPYVNQKEIDKLNVAVHDQVFSYAIRRNQVYYSSDIDHLKIALANHKGFTIVDGGQDTQYSFYPVSDGIAVSKDKIEAKPYFNSYYYESKKENSYYTNGYIDVKGNWHSYNKKRYHAGSSWNYEDDEYLTWLMDNEEERINLAQLDKERAIELSQEKKVASKILACNSEIVDIKELPATIGISGTTEIARESLGTAMQRLEETRVGTNFAELCTIHKRTEKQKLCMVCIQELKNKKDKIIYKRENDGRKIIYRN